MQLNLVQAVSDPTVCYKAGGGSDDDEDEEEDDDNDDNCHDYQGTMRNSLLRAFCELILLPSQQASRVGTISLPSSYRERKWAQKHQATHCGHMARLTWLGVQVPCLESLCSLAQHGAAAASRRLCSVWGSGGSTQERCHCLWSLIAAEEIQAPRAHNLLYATQWT